MCFACERQPARDGACRAIERGEDAVARGVDLIPAVRGQLGAHERKEPAQQLAPRPIAQARGKFGRADDVGEQHRRQTALAPEGAQPSIKGLYFGPIETSHVNSYADLLQIGKLMSSSLAAMAEPDHPESADLVEVANEQRQPARQFASRVRDLALARDKRLANCFNREASLMAARRPVRFGFLSDSLAAQFGLLQPTNVNSYVRAARGMLAELSLARRASGRANLLILGYPPLASATLTDKERSAIADYTEELSLEASEFQVGFAAAESDVQACDALMAAL